MLLDRIAVCPIIPQADFNINGGCGIRLDNDLRIGSDSK
jgi:hypothetical protein